MIKPCLSLDKRLNLMYNHSIGWSPEQIAQRNQQYRRQEMSNPSTAYQIETLDKGAWTFRGQSEFKEYLEERGKAWVQGNFCESYRVTAKA